MRVNLWLILVVFCYLMSGSLASNRIHFPNDENDENEDESISAFDSRVGDEAKADADGYCTRVETKKKAVMVSVPYTVMEKVYTRCRGYYFKKCLVEKPVTRTRDEQQIQDYQETVRGCCDGYIESPDKRCVPFCAKSCVYGNCTLPNTCTCYEGYTSKADKPNECEPFCGGCTHGTCKAPNICFCHPGYNWDTEIAECVPVCDGGCLNGKCIEPEKCQCEDGYEHHPNISICIPHCNASCVHGTCIETDKCECDFGYHFANGSQSVCEPFCEMSCKNAKCVEPNVCECHDGYSIADDDKPHECHCGLYCAEVDGMCHCLDEGQRVKGDQIRNNISSICTESNCENGVCLTPFECDCYEGFEKDENNKCAAVNETCIDEPSVCNGNDPDPHACSCVNGICSANHTCVCVNGFKMSEGHTDLCEPHCSKECANGFCINPDACECDPGYTIRNESESHICYPICAEAEDHDGCINGTCTAPDTCTCHQGFEFEIGSNHTCMPLPYTAQPQKHWIMFGTIPAIAFIASLTLAAYYIHQRKNRKYSGPIRDDGANEPITAYMNEDM